MPCSEQMEAISLRSSMVKWLAEWERMFSCPMPKYTESAPALMAAASDSREPTGAIISKSDAFAFMGAKLDIFFVISSLFPQVFVFFVPLHKIGCLRFYG